MGNLIVIFSSSNHFTNLNFPPYLSRMILQKKQQYQQNTIIFKKSTIYNFQSIITIFSLVISNTIIMILTDITYHLHYMYSYIFSEN